MNHPFLCSLKTEGKRENQTQTEEVELIVVASSFVVGMLAAGGATCCEFFLTAIAAQSKLLQCFSFQIAYFASSTPSEPPHLFASPPSEYDYRVRAGDSLSLAVAGFFPAQERRMQLFSGRGCASGARASANHGVHGKFKKKKQRES